MMGPEAHRVLRYLRQISEDLSGPPSKRFQILVQLYE